MHVCLRRAVQGGSAHSQISQPFSSIFLPFEHSPNPGQTGLVSGQAVGGKKLNVHRKKGKKLSMKHHVDRIMSEVRMIALNESKFIY